MKTWIVTFILSFIPLTIFAMPNWSEWVYELKRDAIAQNIDPNLFDQIFNNIHGPNPKVIHFEQTQPERRITFMEYRNSRADHYKIAIGRKEYQKNQAMLNNIGNTYHVDPCYIVALWGMETSYGRYMGNYPVIQSLATLAYSSSRREDFRQELLLALQIINQHQVTLSQFKGEWAGASGQPQFLPSSWFKYAVDFDQDGRKDIWTSKTDTFASIANYLAQNGWQNNMPFLVEVSLPDQFDLNLIGKAIEKPVKVWNDLGVRTMNGESLYFQELNASIIQPEGGPTYLIYPNFKVILTYNNSIYYAGTINYMAREICGPKN